MRIRACTRPQPPVHRGSSRTTHSADSKGPPRTPGPETSPPPALTPPTPDTDLEPGTRIPPCPGRPAGALQAQFNAEHTGKTAPAKLFFEKNSGCARLGIARSKVHQDHTGVGVEGTASMPRCKNTAKSKTGLRQSKPQEGALTHRLLKAP